TFGSPSEARDLVGGPYHAVMPRALRGRFEPLDHFVLGHLSILGPLSALGSPHAAKRFIGLAIVVRGKDRGSREVLHAQHAIPVNDRREKRVVDLALSVLCREDAVAADDVSNCCRVTCRSPA